MIETKIKENRNYIISFGCNTHKAHAFSKPMLVFQQFLTPIKDHLFILSHAAPKATFEI